MTSTVIISISSVINGNGQQNPVLEMNSCCVTVPLMKEISHIIRNKLDVPMLREDCRKFGINMLTVGFVGGIVSHTSNITVLSFLFYSMIGVVGLTFTIAGLIKRGN